METFSLSMELALSITICFYIFLHVKMTKTEVADISSNAKIIVVFNFNVTQIITVWT